MGKDNITTALRQPGSSIKPVTYTDAFLKGFTAATSIVDSPITFRGNGGPLSTCNYDSRFHGTLTLRQAPATLVNIPAVKLLNAVGVASMIDLAGKWEFQLGKNPKIRPCNYFRSSRSR